MVMLTCSSAPGLPLSGSVTADGFNASAYSARFTVASPSSAALLDPCTTALPESRSTAESPPSVNHELVKRRAAGGGGRSLTVS